MGKSAAKRLVDLGQRDWNSGPFGASRTGYKRHGIHPRASAAHTSTMLMAIGMFVFSNVSLAPDGIDRDRDWRHEPAAGFRARASSQFAGPGDDCLVLSGSLVLELAGDYSAIEKLAELAEQVEAWPLTNGRGEICRRRDRSSLHRTSGTDRRALCPLSGGTPASPRRVIDLRL